MMFNVYFPLHSNISVPHFSKILTTHSHDIYYTVTLQGFQRFFSTSKRQICVFSNFGNWLSKFRMFWLTCNLLFIFCIRPLKCNSFQVSILWIQWTRIISYNNINPLNWIVCWVEFSVLDRSHTESHDSWSRVNVNKQCEYWILPSFSIFIQIESNWITHIQ